MGLIKGKNNLCLCLFQIMVDAELDFANDGLWLAKTTMTSHDVTTAAANDDALSTLLRFSRWYSGVHGYLCIAVCVFGIVSNILNIVVLTDRRMASSPTNFILTALAISDMLPMLSYLPYAVYFHCVAGVQPDPRHGYPRAWIIFLLFNNSFITKSPCSSCHRNYTSIRITGRSAGACALFLIIVRQRTLTKCASSRATTVSSQVLYAGLYMWSQWRF